MEQAGLLPVLLVQFTQGEIKVQCAGVGGSAGNQHV